MGIRIKDTINLQRNTERLIGFIENENYARARLELNAIQKSAQNRLDYLQRRAKTGADKGLERVVLKQEISRAKADLKSVKESVSAVRNTIKREELKERLARTGSRKLYGSARKRAEQELSSVRKKLRNEQGIQAGINRLNEYTARREAQAKTQAQLQSKGTTTRRYKAQQKLSALWVNMIFQNSDYDLSESKIENLNKVLKDLLGYDLKGAIERVLSRVDSDRGSDDVYEGLQNICLDIQQIERNAIDNNLLSENDIKIAENAIKELIQSCRVNL